jgi:hypothetical protein
VGFYKWRRFDELEVERVPPERMKFPA